MLRTSLTLAAATLLLTAAALAQPSAPAAPRAPAPLQVPNPHFVVVPLSIDVKAPVDKVWARVGNFCDIAKWGIPGCTLLSGDGGLGSERALNNGTILEVMVAKTKYSYTYTQPVREGVTYNLYHGTVEAVPLTPATTRILYTFVYDNSMLADDAARDKEITTRKARFNKMLDNMKVLGEGGTLPPGAIAPAGGNPPAATR